MYMLHGLTELAAYGLEAGDSSRPIGLQGCTQLPNGNGTPNWDYPLHPMEFIMSFRSVASSAVHDPMLQAATYCQDWHLDKDTLHVAYMCHTACQVSVVCLDQMMSIHSMPMKRGGFMQFLSI